MRRKRTYAEGDACAGDPVGHAVIGGYGSMGCDRLLKLQPPHCNRQLISHHLCVNEFDDGL
jgi:hypothetical protein